MPKQNDSTTPEDQEQTPVATAQASDPTDGTTPVTIPSQDACCQSPCDPAWRTEPSCTVFTETKTATVFLGNAQTTADFGRGVVTINVDRKSAV